MSDADGPDAISMEALVEQSPDAVIFADSSGVIRVWNAASERIFGHTREQAIGQLLDLIVPERFREAHWEGFERAIVDGETKYAGQSLPTRALRGDGEQFYVELSFAIVRNDEGEVVGALYLRSNLKGMYSHLERYFFGVAVVTFFAFILALLLSSRLQKVISQPILALAGTMKEVSQKQSYSIRAEKHGGDEIGVLIDGFNNMLSQIQTREENLRTAQLQAEMANRTKSEFLAAMSHELRTPLNAILGFSEIMKNELMGPLGTPEYRDYAGDIHDSGTHLLEVINDILDISKIEAGKLELKEEQVSVNDLITKSVRLMKERAENAGLDIAIEIEPGLPLLFVDPRLVKQSLINLLSNAIKFTPQGGHVTVRTMKEDGGAIAMAVSDTGIGIAAEDIDHVLVPFGQVDSSLSRKYEGTGLGLPLVKSFIELHGGTLTIDSAIGLGTTVTIRFPAERAVGPGTVFKAANQ